MLQNAPPVLQFVPAVNFPGSGGHVGRKKTFAEAGWQAEGGIRAGAARHVLLNTRRLDRGKAGLDPRRAADPVCDAGVLALLTVTMAVNLFL